MENVTGNKVLCLNNEENIKRKKAVLLNLMKSGVDILTFFDTETTGLNIYPRKSDGILRDRILEVGFVMYFQDRNGEIKPVMLDGKPITFQEYINPFKEGKERLAKSESTMYTNPEALEVHKITNNFLFGKEEFNGIKLHKAAPTFAQVKPFMEDILCLNEMADLKGTMHFIAHNGIGFDAPMLTEEMHLVDKFNPDIKNKRDFESMIPNFIDTLVIGRDLYDREDLTKINEERPTNVKVGYSLSYLSHVLKVEETGREDFHGALLDSEILKNVFQSLINTPEWKSSANRIEFNKMGQIDKVENLLPIDIKENKNISKNELTDVLQIIKTDASFHEGTGTVKEYIERAKELDLKSLVMADVVSVSRFVDFYEGCKKEGINPIIATTFKMDSTLDIYNFIDKNKVNGSTQDIYSVISKVLGNNEIDSIEDFIKNYDVSIEGFQKIAKSIDELNKKKYTNRETKADGLKKATVKAVKAILSEADIKYVEKDYELKDIENEILSKRNIIKYKEYNIVDDQSDLLLIAKDDNGFRSLKELITLANRDGQTFLKEGAALDKGEQPLLKISQLEGHTKGLIAAIGSKNDVLGLAVQSNAVRRAQTIVKDFKDIFGDDLYYQISTNSISENKGIENDFNKKVSLVSEKQGLKPLAVHYANFALREDLTIHKNKYAILRDETSSSVKLDTGSTEHNCLKSEEELKKAFQYLETAMTNSFDFSERSNLNPVLHKPTLPTYVTKGGRSQKEELYDLILKGLDEKMPSIIKKAIRNGKIKAETEYNKIYDEYKKRADYEFGVISDMDFPGYFLIEKQMVDYCRSEGIMVGVGRGSGAGSLVNYCLGITSVDPLPYDLLFERFLNPDRKEMPDIDTDIDGEHREKVLKYLSEQYEKEGLGYGGAAYIMTSGTFSAKNTIKAMAKAYGLTNRWAEDLSKIISNEPDVKLEDEIEYNEELSERFRTEPRTRMIIEAAMQLEKNGGRQASTGKHPGGIVVGDLINQAPITYVKGVPVVQADKKKIEALGAVKFDLLGLNTLSKIERSFKNIEKTKGIEELEKHGIFKKGLLYDFEDFIMEDEATFKMIQDGNTTNVFQIESDLFKGLEKSIKPNSLEEITALVSLGRPGPLQAGMVDFFVDGKNDPNKRHRYHPLIDPILDTTHGTIIYQEQVMAIAQKLSGFTMGQADKLRSAMSKKKLEEIQKLKVQFIEGATKNNVPEEVSENIFKSIEKFAGYGFNKSHALSYSILTYQTAFLRKHYPSQTMAAIMSIDANGSQAHKKALPKDISSCKEVGLTLFTPNINNSELEFIAGKTTGILYGLDGIKGTNFKKVYDEREQNGKFENIADFMARCGASKSVETLIKSGAMDCLSLIDELDSSQKNYLKTLPKEEIKIAKRKLLLNEYEMLSKPLSSVVKRKSFDLEIFKKETNVKEDYSCTINNFKKEKDKYMAEFLISERECLGGYITAHPLDIGETRNQLKKGAESPLIKFNQLELPTVKKEENTFAVMGMVLESKGNITSAAGNLYARLEVNDETTSTSLFMQNDMYLKLQKELKAVNGEGLKDGSVVTFNVSFYKKQDGEINSSIDSVYCKNEGITISLTKEKPKYKAKNNY